MDRRRFLVGCAAAGLAGTTPGWARGPEGPPADAGAVFPWGVASGDPAPGAVTLWTRVDTAGPVAWEVGVGDDPRPLVAGTVDPDPAGTARVRVTGLPDGVPLWYRFGAGGRRSPPGRTLTANAGERCRIALVACGRRTDGHFGAYEAAGTVGADLVIHLGDVIYARHPGEPPVRSPEGYRTRHARYRADSGWRALTAAAPLVSIWDDNDVAGGCWSSGAPDVADSDWADVRDAATGAFAAWMPDLPHPGDPLRRWRRLRVGPVEVVVADARLWGRDAPVGSPGVPPEAWEDPDRSMLGPDQEAWLAGVVGGTDAPWVLIAQQVMVGELRLPDGIGGRFPTVRVEGGWINPDQWDGWPAARRRLLEAVAASPASVVTAAGDLHSTWVRDLLTDGAVAAGELVAPSATSTSLGARLGPMAALLAAAPGVVAPGAVSVDPSSHGFLVVDADPQMLAVRQWVVDVTRAGTSARPGGRWWRTHGGPWTTRPPRPTTTVTSTPPSVGGITGPGTDPPSPDASDPGVPSGRGRPPWAAPAVGLTVAGAAAGAALALRRRRSPAVPGRHVGAPAPEREPGAPHGAVRRDG